MLDIPTIKAGLAGVVTRPAVSTEIAVVEFVASCIVFTLSIDAIVYPMLLSPKK
tara:strand:- start:2 stop:163 length:162 start_codon:yes stop_codon:yes gene_type:complete